MNSSSSTSPETQTRPAGATEQSWCRAVPGGTGITVLAVHLTTPIPTTTIEKAIHTAQLHHPILRSKINPPSGRKSHFFFSIPPLPTAKVESFHSLEALSDGSEPSVLRSIVEHELNINPWKTTKDASSSGVDILFARVYALEAGSVVLVLKLHTAVADRVSGAVIVEEVLRILGEGGDVSGGDEGKVLPPLEELVPPKLKSKALWARGIGMVGYSMNFLRSSMLPFIDAKAPRVTRTVVIEFGVEETMKLLSECKERGIKLCGVLTAAGLIASVKTRNLPSKKYETHTTITLINCRNRITEVLSSHDVGFYHTAIQNLHTVNGEEELWQLSTKCYSTFADARDHSKDFSDMADLNILMMKAIDNPGLTPSSSMRTALISVFEEPEIYDSNEFYQGVGVEDYLGCSSTHGVGASIGVFNVIKDGRLICTCLYPSPLHSRELMQNIVDEMKRIMISSIA